MNIDISTLAVVLGILSVLQVVAISLQYLINKTYSGIGWWLLWSASTTAGFTVMLLRNCVPSGFILTSIFLTNVLLFLGHIFLYIGIMRFLERKEHRVIIALIFICFILSNIYFMYMYRNDNARTSILYLSAAIISFLTMQSLLTHKIPSISTSANSLAVVFFIHGCYFFFRSTAALSILPFDEVFSPTLLQTATFFVQFITSYLWALGLIILLNQRSNAKISETKEQFELIFSTGPDAALITRLQDGCIVETNERFTKLTGFARAEVIGKSTLDLPIWQDPEDRQKIVTELNRNRFVDDLEIVFLRKDGKQFNGLVSAKLITLQGMPHIMSVTRDITNSKLAEVALRKSEENFRLLVENSYDIIYSINTNGVFLFVSPAWTRLLGFPTSQVVGKSFQPFIHPDDIPGCMVFLQSVIETGQRQEGVEYRVRSIDGIWYWHTSSAVPFTDKAGTIVGFYGIAKDISERKKKEEEMRNLISRLQKAIEEIKTLKGIVPICCHCKKIRDDEGFWEQVEAYVSKRTEAQFSHSICPDCMKSLYPEFSEDKKNASK